MINTDVRLNQANGRLRSGKVGVAILQRGNRLYLRATLPPKPGSHRTTPHQQELSLGVHANTQGVKLAEAQARKVGALLDCKDFTWSDYIKPHQDSTEGRRTPYLHLEHRVETPTTSEMVKRFKDDYFTKRPTNPKTLTTWSKDYLPVFHHLPQDVPLDASVILSTITSTTPDTRTRKRYCVALSALARYAGVQFDPKPYTGQYRPGRLNPRDIPTDAEIVEVYNQIKDKAWRWAYGMLATYGLRPHELLYLDLTDLPVLNVTDGKTGYRKVWPYLPSWVDKFDLLNTKRPSLCVTPTNNRQGGGLVSKRFKRMGVPFKLYDLRHAWSIRTLMLGLPVSLAAAQQGHRVRMHTETYHAWLTDKHHQDAYDLITSRLP